MSQEEEINKLLNEARELKEKGSLGIAKNNLERALELGKEHFGLEHRRIALIYIEIGDIWASVDFENLSKPNFEKALKILIKSNKTKIVFSFCIERGFYYAQRSLFFIAKYFFKKSIEIDPENSDSWCFCGNASLELNEYNNAINEYSKAISINPENSAALYQRAESYKLIGNFNHALEDYLLVVKIEPEFDEAWDGIGFSKYYLGDFKGSIAAHNKAIKINPKKFIYWFYRGTSKEEIFDFKGAIADYSKAIKINQKYEYAWYNRGHAKEESGDYIGAIKDYTEAINLNSNLAEAWVNLGSSKAHLFEYQSGIADCTVAIKINPLLAEAWACRGSIKVGIEEYKSAIKDFNRAIKINPSYINARLNRGIAKYKLQNHKGAIKDLNKVKKLLLSQKNPDKTILWMYYFFISSCYYDCKDYIKSLSNCQKALFCYYKESPNNYSISPNYFDIKKMREDVQLLFTKAACLFKLQENTKRYLGYSLNTYWLAFKWLQETRNKIQSLEARLNFQSMNNDFKRLSLNASNEGIKLGVSENNIFFKLSESLKSAVFFETISHFNFLLNSKIDKKLLNRYSALVQELVSMQILPSMKMMFDQEHTILKENRIVEIENSIEKELKEIKKKHPNDFKRLLSPARIINLNELQEYIDYKTSLVIYSFGADNVLFISTVLRNSFKIYEVQLDEGFYDDLDGFYRSIENKDQNFIFRGLACRLFEKLIKPVAADIQYDKNTNGRGIKNLIIIPDGVLYKVPFEALYFTKDLPESESEIPYLVNEYTITYHYSASLWAESKKRGDASEELSSFLGFAPVFENKPKVPETKSEEKNKIKSEPESDTGDTHNLDPLKSFAVGGRIVELPESDREITESAMLYDPMGKSFRKEKAIKARFMEEANRYKICHLSTHGYYDVANPAESGIWFYTDGKEDKGKCFLFAGELYNMDLKGVELFILSACETHLDDTKEGEGFIGLTRGAHAAGARNVVASKWKVQNEATIELMINFHRNISRAMPYGEALREAKSALLRTSEFAHPFYWASFVLNGVGGKLPLGSW